LANQSFAAVQYGARITAILVYLSVFQFVPLDRLKTLMINLFGVTLSRASIKAMTRRTVDRKRARRSERLLGFADAVRQLILLAPIKHIDETDLRIVKTLKPNIFWLAR